MSAMNIEINGVKPFPSLASLTEVHTKLLKASKDDETGPVLDEIDTFIRRASATGALLDNENDRYASQSMLDYWMTVLYRTDRTPPDGTLAEFDPSLSPKLDDELCPYRGLNAFQEEDKELYYGRTRLINLLLDKLKATRLLFLVGPSGSGKSSLALAGLIPALKANRLDGSKQWQYPSPIIPGRNPLKSLAMAVKSPHHPAEWLPQQIEGLKRDPQHLLKTLAHFGSEPAVLIVDQFEEVFTLCTDDAMRNAFINNLLSLVQDPERRHIVILTMRTDFESYLVLNPNLMSLFEEGQVRITPLTAADLRDAIEEPARRIGLKFEDGVVDALVSDILGEPEGLPLLQFTLLQLWKTRADGRNRITLSQYRKLGSARRALALTADELYKRLNYADRETFKRIMLRLALPSGTLEVTRNPVSRENLYFEDPTRVNNVLENLRKAGLVRITKGDTDANDKVEVAHEALVRHWPTLVDWIEKERVTLRQRRRLTSAAEQWLEHGKDEGGLLGGSLLDEALRYEDLNELEREFVAQSKAARARVEQQKAEARQREEQLDRERVLALEQKNVEITKNATRMRQFLFVLIPLTFVLLIATGAAFWLSAKASASEKKATVALQDAETKKEEANKQRELAERRGEELAQIGESLNYALDEAVDAKKKAEVQRLLAEKQAKLAAEAKQRAIADKLRVEEQKRVIDRYSKQLEKYNEEKEQQLKLRERKDTYNEILTKAEGLRLTGDLGTAEKLYAQLLDEYRDISDLGGKEDILSKLALVYFMSGEKEKRRGDEDSAVKYYRWSVDRYNQAETIIKGRLATAQGEEAIGAHLKLAQFYRAHSRWIPAEQEYMAALKQQETMLLTRRYMYSDFENLVEVIREFYGSRKDTSGLEKLYKQVIETKEKFYAGNKNREVYEAYKMLAKFYDEEDRDDEAEGPYLKALSIAEDAITEGRSLVDEMAPYVLEAQVNLGDLYAGEMLGDYPQAEDYYQKALTTYTGMKVKAKIKSASIYIKLANVLRLQSRYDKALESYEKAIAATSSEEHGKESAALATILNNMGEIYQAKSNYAKAKELYAEAHEKLEKGGSQPNQAELARTLLNLAGISYIYGNQSATPPEATKSFEEGDTLLARALSIYPKALEEAEDSTTSYFRTQDTTLNIGELYSSVLARMVKRIKEGDGTKLRSAEILYQKLTRLYRKQSDKLLALNEQVRGVFKESSSPEFYHTLWLSYDEQGHSYDSAGKFAEAEDMFKKALALGEGPLVKDTSRAYYSMIDLVELYLKQRKNAEAEAVYLRGIETFKKIEQGQGARTLEILAGYSRFLRILNRTADADKIEEEIKRIRGNLRTK